MMVRLTALPAVLRCLLSRLHQHLRLHRLLRLKVYLYMFSRLFSSLYTHSRLYSSRQDSLWLSQ